MTTTYIIFICIIIILAFINTRFLLRQPSGKHHFMLPEQIKLHISSNDIMQYLKENGDHVKPLFEQKGIEFNFKCEPESMMGWFDTELLHGIQLLLLSDAIKRMKQDERVSITVYTNQNYDSINIHISDNGSEMSATGLAIVKHLVAVHRGKFTNNYVEKEGNNMIIELPIKKDAYETEQLESSSSSAFHIPNNIELHIPTIEIPSGYEEGNSSLREIMRPHHSADHEFLRRAIKCINDHISETDYDRQTFASDMGCSVSTLYNKIREVTGKNISNFARDIRIKTACKLAKENADLRVSDIAYQVGFKDPKYFATSFKRVTGMQPKEYFAKLRGEEL